ncbi:hypothetical protein CDAR_238891 [Caerostris darwini]|uniref:Uncharacterized protein n=1 Tax=Caerostris darwini TaxID=1538125 RepID=A0AAV4PT52_9ARAC|nr:hypothetical protein CDAR_238891 [Caerostris darwini]
MLQSVFALMSSASKSGFLRFSTDEINDFKTRDSVLLSSNSAQRQVIIVSIARPPQKYINRQWERSEDERAYYANEGWWGQPSSLYEPNIHLLRATADTIPSSKPPSLATALARLFFAVNKPFRNVHDRML